MSLEALLATLADGHFHSGDELGVALGVSRTAVWKQIKKIEGLGLSLESIKGKGYRIPGGLDLLSEVAIRQGLSQQAKSLLRELDIEGVIDSTNTKAMSKAIQGVSGYVCLAERQVAGKGRRGRKWSSPYASGIFLSIVWEFSGGVASLEGLSLAVGIAVTNALTRAGVNGTKLKWPNDILFNDKKLSGILLEIAGDAQGPCKVIIGIGINVATPKDKMLEVDQPWVDIESITSKSISRNQLTAFLLDELTAILASFEKDGFKLYQNRWQELDAYSGKNVSITIGEDVVIGKSCGVDSSGALIIETDSGRQIFNGGEVSLRLSDAHVS